MFLAKPPIRACGSRFFLSSLSNYATQPKDTDPLRPSKFWAKPDNFAAKNKLQVIMLENSPAGQKGEVAYVRKGYAKSYLFTRKIGVQANRTTLEQHKEIIQSVDYDEIQKVKVQRSYRSRINRAHVIVRRHLVNDKPHAPLQKADICKHLLYQYGIKIEPEHILLEQPIKTFGEYGIGVDFNIGEIIELRVTFTSFAAAETSTDKEQKVKPVAKGAKVIPKAQKAKSKSKK